MQRTCHVCITVPFVMYQSGWVDIVGILEWNERFGIRFMRISSEMFPFASHAELGYTLEFAKPELSAAGRIAMKYGHRLTMHPVFFPSRSEIEGFRANSLRLRRRSKM